MRKADKLVRNSVCLTSGVIMKPKTISIFSLTLIVNFAYGINQEKLVNYNINLDKLVDSLNIKKESIIIRIDKSEFVLSVLFGEEIIKQYPVVLGPNPIDDKRREGDDCTPEGNFKMVDKYSHRSWKYFIWINYPTPDSWVKHKAAKEDGSILANVTIGSEIGIHGVPAGMDHLIDSKTNWTAGCISLKNKDIADLYPHILKETDIIINH
jgi:murein L,D-transpeptidase YafK